MLDELGSMRPWTPRSLGYFRQGMRPASGDRAPRHACPAWAFLACLPREITCQYSTAPSTPPSPPPTTPPYETWDCGVLLGDDDSWTYELWRTTSLANENDDDPDTPWYNGIPGSWWHGKTREDALAVLRSACAPPSPPPWPPGVAPIPVSYTHLTLPTIPLV